MTTHLELDTIEDASDIPFVGRNEELASALQEFERCEASSRGRVLNVVGPQGSGKTRLLRELEQELRAHHSAPEVLVIGAHAPCSVLDLLERVRQCDASRTPLCVLFDDAGVSDEDALGQLARAFSTAKTPMLAVVAGRTEPDCLAAGSHAPCTVRTLELGPLARRSYTDLVEALLSDCPPESRREVVQCVTDATSGYPGSALKGVQYLYEQHLLTIGDHGVVVAEGQLRMAVLPVRQEERVAASVFACSALERRVLEAAAIVGPVFWERAVVAALASTESKVGRTSVDPAAVQQALARLVESHHVSKIVVSRILGETEYAFRDPTERDYVVTRTPSALRREHHRAIAGWLEHRPEATSVRDLCALRAGHHELGGSPLAAGVAYLDAADEARLDKANVLAERWYRTGLGLLGDFAPRRRLEALANHGATLSALGRPKEAVSAFQGVAALAERLSLTASGCAARGQLSRLYREIGDLQSAEACLRTALSGYTQALDLQGIATVHDELGQVSCARGDFAEAAEHFESALSLRQTFDDKLALASSLENLGRVRLDQGNPTEAERAITTALCLTREANDLAGTVQCLIDLGRLASERAEYPLALQRYEEAERLTAPGHRDELALITGLGETHRRLGDAPRAIELLSRAIRVAERTGDALGSAIAHRALSKAYLKVGDLAQATNAIRVARRICSRLKNRVHLARVLRTVGEIAAAGGWYGRKDKAVSYFMRSIALFKELGNELGVAKGYHAFAIYATQPEYRSNKEIQDKARQVEAMAQEVFVRHRSAPPVAA